MQSMQRNKAKRYIDICGNETHWPWNLSLQSSQFFSHNAYTFYNCVNHTLRDWAIDWIFKSNYVTPNWHWVIWNGEKVRAFLLSRSWNDIMNFPFPLYFSIVKESQTVGIWTETKLTCCKQLTLLLCPSAVWRHFVTIINIMRLQYVRDHKKKHRPISSKWNRKEHSHGDKCKICFSLISLLFANNSNTHRSRMQCIVCCAIQISVRNMSWMNRSYCRIAFTFLYSSVLFANIANNCSIISANNLMAAIPPRRGVPDWMDIPKISYAIFNFLHVLLCIHSNCIRIASHFECIKHFVDISSDSLTHDKLRNGR